MRTMMILRRLLLVPYLLSAILVSQAFVLVATHKRRIPTRIHSTLASSPAVPRITTARTHTGPLLSASNANELNPLKSGSTVALLTPFHADTGKIDFVGLRRLLQFHVAQGTDNLCILGTTGEASVLTAEQRGMVLKIAVEEAKGKMPIMVGVGSIDPQHVKEMTLQAIDIGCDAALIVTPYYVKPPQRCLIQHFTTAAYTGLPVVIYNVPGRTGVDMKDESIAIAALHENIVAVKDATGNLDRVTNLKRELERNGVSKQFLLYSGDDSTSMEYCLLGGDGCISVTANLAPNAMHRLVAAARMGDAEAAKIINDPLVTLHNKLFVESNPIVPKWAAHRTGLINSAYCRPPLDYMDSQFEPVVEDALRQAGLL